MKPRPGTTLVEVLVTIFVMGIGLLALLTLFPLGALSMAQAIQDDLATHAQANATALAEALDLRNDANITAVFTNATDPNGLVPQDQNGNNVGALTSYTGYDGPSFLVYVDGYGSLAITPKAQYWVGDALSPRTVARRSPSYVTLANLPSLFNLLDDIKFADSGVADTAPSGGAEFEREGAFSWAYLLRRPRLSVASAVDMSVVVYNHRPLRRSNNLDPSESGYTGTFSLANNTVTLTWNTGTQSAPQIRPGGWILDGTIEIRGPAGSQYPWPHGFFYRVTDVGDVTLAGANGSLQLSVGTPFREFLSTSNLTGTVFIMDAVAAVYEKGAGWQP